MLPTVSGEFRVVADPELRFTPSGKAVVSCRIVANSRKKEGEEWVDDKECWLNLSAWDRMAENIAESVEKGALIVVSGRLETRAYETREGEKRQSYDLHVNEIGPSLRWNAAKVIKTERADSGGATAPAGGGEPAPAADPWGTPVGGSDEPPF